MEQHKNFHILVCNEVSAVDLEARLNMMAERRVNERLGYFFWYELHKIEIVDKLHYLIFKLCTSKV